MGPAVRSIMEQTSKLWDHRWKVQLLAMNNCIELLAWFLPSCLNSPHLAYWWPELGTRISSRTMNQLSWPGWVGGWAPAPYRSTHWVSRSGEVSSSVTDREAARCAACPLLLSAAAGWLSFPRPCPWADFLAKRAEVPAFSNRCAVNHFPCLSAVKKSSSKAPRALRALWPKLILPPSFWAEQGHWLGSGGTTSAFISQPAAFAGLCSSFQAFSWSPFCQIALKVHTHSRWGCELTPWPECSTKVFIAVVV